jgi:hypothetical protein
MTTTATYHSQTGRRFATAVAATFLALVCAAAVWIAAAGSALAPEPARLNSTLYSSGADSATYINTLRATNAYFVSSSWMPSSVPAGTPCSTTAPVPAGTILTKVVVASGGYRKCQ